MHCRNYVIFTCLALLLFGCNAKQQIKGRHYLDIQNYKKGITSFEDAVRENPDDPAANYYLGRFYLVEKENKKALFHLLHAAQLSPDNADYHFWLGMAHAANGQSNLERKSYRRTLELNPKHLPAQINLGHNLFENEKGSLAETLEHFYKKIGPLAQRQTERCRFLAYNRAV